MDEQPRIDRNYLREKLRDVDNKTFQKIVEYLEEVFKKHGLKDDPTQKEASRQEEIVRS